jgi:hypothetical protein
MNDLVVTSKCCICSAKLERVYAVRLSMWEHPDVPRPTYEFKLTSPPVHLVCRDWYKQLTKEKGGCGQ